MRLDLDDRDDTLQSRIREAELSWVPYIIVLGDREIKTGELSVRSREQGKELKTSASDFSLAMVVVACVRGCQAELLQVATLLRPHLGLPLGAMIRVEPLKDDGGNSTQPGRTDGRDRHD